MMQQTLGDCLIVHYISVHTLNMLHVPDAKSLTFNRNTLFYSYCMLLLLHIDMWNRLILPRTAHNIDQLMLL